MEKIVEFKNLSFRYHEKYALKNINLSVNEGELVVVCGKSGCGKSTLLRHIKKSLTPHGSLEGEIYFSGKNINTMDLREESSQIGFVMQNPDNQIVTDKVWHEIAFGLENLGMANHLIRRKTAEISAFFGIDKWFHKSVSELSGGQKQLLNLASVMIMEPKLLILDEPTAQLDPIAAENFLAAVGRINRELGTTVIIAEHRLQEILPMSDKMVILENGEIVKEGNARDCGRWLSDNRNGMFAAMPAPMIVYAQVKSSMECPVTVSEGRTWLKETVKDRELRKIEIKPYEANVEYAVEMNGIWFRYGRDLPDVLRGLDLKVKKGEIYTILGGNGAGKSTAMSVLSGINKQYRGKVRTQGKIAVLPQNPQTLFVKNTVYDELCDMGGDITAVSRLCGLEEYYKKHPYDLSGGEQQKLALAKVLLTKSDILILDEPTKGLDAEFKISFASLIRTLKKSGITVIIVSHDVEFAISCSDRCGMFFDGKIVAEDETRTFFEGNSFYNSAAARMSKNIIEHTISVDDIVYALGGEIKEDDTDLDFILEREKEPVPKKRSVFSWVKNDKLNVSQKSMKINRKNTMMIVLMLILIPLTVVFGMTVLGDRKYYITSMLIIAEVIIPFFALFEKRKPKAREIVVVSVLCAIAVVSRMALFMVPQVKPIMAVVIISGIAFGGEIGFLVGSVSAFVSNFFFGQGPWTPWQMFAMGLSGFLAGVILGKLQCRRITVSVVGAMITFVIYGGIMNLSSLLMYQHSITKEMVLTTYAMGIPFDIIHALGVMVFLYIIAKPMLEKLERIKMKYGLLRE